MKQIRVVERLDPSLAAHAFFLLLVIKKKKKEKKRKEKDRFRLFKPFLTATENDFCLLCVLASLKLQTVIIFCDLPVFNETINLKSEAQMVDSNGSLDNLF